MDPLASLAQALSVPASQTSVTFRSTVTPDLTISPFKPSPDATPGLGTALMSLVQPSMTINTPAGSFPVEPWGKPMKSYGVALAVGFGLMGLGGFMFARKFILPRLK